MSISVFSRYSKGFTLIELLVVIAIVGVMSAIALTQLNSARLRGADAQKKSTLKALGNVGILYYELNGNYNGLCNDSKFLAMTTSIGANGTASCTSPGYRVRVQLSDGNWLCTDERGNIKNNGTVDPGTGSSNCPP